MGGGYVGGGDVSSGGVSVSTDGDGSGCCEVMGGAGMSDSIGVGKSAVVGIELRGAVGGRMMW